MNFELIIKLEKKLLNNSIRKNEDELRVLLRDDFIEFGTSGRIYNKQIIIDRLRDEEPIEVEALNFKAIQLSEDVVQLQFKTRRRNDDGSLSASLRSSI